MNALRLRWQLIPVYTVSLHGSGWRFLSLTLPDAEGQINNMHRLVACGNNLYVCDSIHSPSDIIIKLLNLYKAGTGGEWSTAAVWSPSTTGTGKPDAGVMFSVMITSSSHNTTKSRTLTDSQYINSTWVLGQWYLKLVTLCWALITCICFGALDQLIYFAVWTIYTAADVGYVFVLTRTCRPVGIPYM